MRNVSVRLRNLVESTASSDVIVFFVTITHPLLGVPVRVNSDIVDYVLNGNTFVGCAFKLIMLTDDEQAPKAQVSIEDVDQQIGEAVIALPSSPFVQIEIYVKSDFDDNDPHAPIGTAVQEFVAADLRLRNVVCDGATLTGDLTGEDFTQDFYPYYRSEINRTPGLYW